MDEIAHALIQQEEEDEEGDLEQELEQSAALAAVALMVIGAEESRRLARNADNQVGCMSVGHSFFQILIRIPHGRCFTKVALIAPSSPPWDLMWMPSRML